MSEDYLKYDGRMPEPPYETGPAPKEEEMEPIERIAIAMEQQTESYLRNSDLNCMWLTRQLLPKDRVLERRAVARDAYMAALGGLSSIDALVDKGIVQHAEQVAIETVRRWDTFMAAVDAEGGE